MFKNSTKILTRTILSTKCFLPCTRFSRVANRRVEASLISHLLTTNSNRIIGLW